MNMAAGLDEIDEYVDALLGSALDVPEAQVATAAAAGAVVPAGMPPVVAAGPGNAVEGAMPPPLPPTEPRQLPPPPAPQPAAAFQPPVPSRGAPPIASSRWLRVAVGEDSYALELLCVQEVVRVVPIVAMRGANAAVLGVMNLRGRIVPVFDLGLWLGTRCVQPEERSRIVVIERNDELIGVLVTLVEDVVTLTADRIEPPLPGSTRGPIVGVARSGTAPTVLLQAAALFAE